MELQNGRGISSASFVFHLVKVAAGTLLMTAPARLTLWLCKAPRLCVGNLLYLDGTANVCTDCMVLGGSKRHNMPALWYIYFVKNSSGRHIMNIKIMHSCHFINMN